MRTVQTKRNKLRPALLVTLIILLIGAAGFMAYRHTQKSDSSDPTVNLQPATEEEKEQAQAVKDAITDKQGDDPTPEPAPVGTNGKKQASVVIASASSSTVTAYVNGVNEEGGTCTAVFTQGAKTVSRTSNGISNVSYTQCAPITPNLPSGGSWSVIVNYSSATAEGKSQAQTF